MKKMQEREREETQIANKIKRNLGPKRMVVKEVEEIDQYGNRRIIKKLVEEDGLKKAPKTRNLQRKLITRIDSDGNEIQEEV